MLDYWCAMATVYRGEGEGRGGGGGAMITIVHRGEAEKGRCANDNRCIHSNTAETEKGAGGMRWLL